MPAAIPVIAGALISGVSAGSAIAGGVLSIGFSAAAALKSLALGALSLGLDALTSKQQPTAIDAGSGRLQNVSGSIAPRRLIYGRVRVGGFRLHMEATRGPNGEGKADEYLSVVLAHSGHEVDAIEEVWFEGERTFYRDASGALLRDPASRFTSEYVSLDLRHGSADQAVFAGLLDVTEGKWTADHRAAHCALSYARWKWDTEQTVLYGGLPPTTVIVSGRKVFDPRTGETSFSQNPALIILDFLRGFSVGNKYIGGGVAEDEIDHASFIAAANLCDEQVEIPGGGALEPRYQIDAAIDLTDSLTPLQVLEGMLSAMAGRLSYVNGRFRLHGGGYVAPTVFFDEGDLRAGITAPTRQPRDRLFNAVSGKFISREEGYNVAAYPSVESDLYAQEDGEKRWTSLDLLFTSSPSMAQRLARIELNRSRQQISAVLPLNLTALDVAVGDIIAFDFERWGWSEKEFEVVAVTPIMSDVGLIGFDVSVVETSAAIYGEGGDKIYLAGPKTSLETHIYAPQNLSTQAQTAMAADGSQSSFIVASWDESDTASVDSYEVRSRIGDGAFESRLTAHLTMRIGPVPSDSIVEVQVRARTATGRLSAWTQIASIGAHGDQVPPGAIFGLSGESLMLAHRLKWFNPNDPDFDKAVIYRAATDSRDAAIEIDRVDGMSYVLHGQAPGERAFYWVRAIDRSGNLGDWNAEAGVEVVAITAPPGSVAEDALTSSLTETINRIEPLEGSVSDIYTYSLPSIAGQLAQYSADLEGANSLLLDAALDAQETRDILREAEITRDIETGTVRLWALERLGDQITKAEIAIDGINGSLSLSASRAWVEGQIAEAVLDPAEFTSFTNLQAEIADVQVTLDAVSATLDQAATTIQLDHERLRITTAETRLDAVEGEVSSRASQTELDETNANLADAQQTLSALDGASIASTVQATFGMREDFEDIQDAALDAALTEDERQANTIKSFAIARTEIHARIDEEGAARAGSIGQLAVRVEDQSAALQEEREVRADENEALASSIDALAAGLGDQSAALQEEREARIAADGSIHAQYSVQVDVGGHVSGFGLIGAVDEGGNAESAFSVVADRFLVALPNGGAEPVRAFNILDINGTPTVALAGDMIAAGTITAAKLNVRSLSSISATIGTLRSAESGERVEISDDRVSVYDENGTLRVRLGRL